MVPKLKFTFFLKNIYNGIGFLPEVTGRATDPAWIDLSGTPTAINWLKHSNPDDPDALDLLKKNNSVMICVRNIHK